MRNNFVVKKSTAEVASLIGITAVLYATGADMPANIVFFVSMAVLLYKSWKNPEWLAAALIILETRVFGTGPNKIFGILPEKLEIAVLLVSWVFWAFKGFCNKKKIPSEYKWLQYTAVIIVVAAVMGYVTIGQSILFGIFLQTRLLVIFSVFPIIAMMKEKTDSFSSLWNLTKKLALIQACVNTIQMVLYPRIQFLTITSENIRFGSIRITYGYVLIAIAFMMAFSEFLDNLDIKNGLYCLVYLIDILFVCKTRMVIFGMAVSAAIVVLGKLKYKTGWKKMIVLALLGGLVLIAMSDRITDLVTLTKTEVSTNSGNYVARTDEIAFYTAQVKNPILGRGYISPKSAGGEAFDTKYGYFSLTDIGVIGLYTMNGLMGIVWFGIIAIVLIRRARHCPYKIYGIEYVIYSMTVCMTLLNFYYSSEYLVITLILLADEFREIQFLKKGNQ